MISFTDFVAAAATAFDAANRLNSRAPLFCIETAKGKQLYCGWNIDRAVRLMATNKNARGVLATFDIDGAPLFDLPMPH